MTNVYDRLVLQSIYRIRGKAQKGSGKKGVLRGKEGNFVDVNIWSYMNVRCYMLLRSFSSWHFDFVWSRFYFIAARSERDFTKCIAKCCDIFLKADSRPFYHGSRIKSIFRSFEYWIEFRFLLLGTCNLLVEILWNIKSHIREFL